MKLWWNAKKMVANQTVVKYWNVQLEEQFIAEPIIGHRCWALGGYGGLQGWFKNERWPTRQAMEAKCLRNIYALKYNLSPSEIRAHLHEKAPYQHCHCGIYAYRTESNVFTRGPVDVTLPFAIGEVYLWGNIIEHDSGYRAEFAYPKEISLYLPYDAPQLEEAYMANLKEYGVPVLPLEERYPELALQQRLQEDYRHRQRRYTTTGTAISQLKWTQAKPSPGQVVHFQDPNDPPRP